MCGLEFEIIPADIDEDSFLGRAPEKLVRDLSFEKAAVIARQNPEAAVIGADTIVVLDGKVLGKPKDKDDAIDMLMRLQGRIHLVVGGFTILDNGERLTESCETKVTFMKLTPQEIKAYVETGEPMDKAGAYGAQGIGASFVDKIEGSYTNVVGLPLRECIAALKRLGIVTIK
jgi:septum formation protein